MSQKDFSSIHSQWMRHALVLAKEAQIHGEVPVGAIVIYQNSLIGAGFNQPISSQDPTAHAEIIALRTAAKEIGNYRLVHTTLYVTIEPCMMCLGAMVHGRVENLIFGAREPKAGAVCSAFQLLENKKLNHHIKWEEGILASECAELLQLFFKNKRR